MAGGGQGNLASGNCTTVCGGIGNLASGNRSTVAGGHYNAARGDYSFAAGLRAKIDAAHGGSFLFADENYFDFPSAAANEFAIRCTGGARFVAAIDGSGSPTAGVKLDPGDNQWTVLSDRNAKRHVKAVDAKDILERLKRIPVHTWSYKTQDPCIRHIGPMAQDFYAAFGVGADEKRIGTLDADGVALAAIQGLHQIVKEKDTQIAAQREQMEAQQEQIADLTARLLRIEAMLETGGSGSKSLAADVSRAAQLGQGRGLRR
jgi:hypothetical protein